MERLFGKQKNNWLKSDANQHYQLVKSLKLKTIWFNTAQMKIYGSCSKSLEYLFGKNLFCIGFALNNVCTLFVLCLHMILLVNRPTFYRVSTVYFIFSLKEEKTQHFTSFRPWCRNISESLLCFTLFLSNTHLIPRSA